MYLAVELKGRTGGRGSSSSAGSSASHSTSLTVSFSPREDQVCDDWIALTPTPDHDDAPAHGLVVTLHFNSIAFWYLYQPTVHPVAMMDGWVTLTGMAVEDGANITVTGTADVDAEDYAATYADASLVMKIGGDGAVAELIVEGGDQTVPTGLFNFRAPGEFYYKFKPAIAFNMSMLRYGCGCVPIDPTSPGAVALAERIHNALNHP